MPVLAEPARCAGLRRLSTSVRGRRAEARRHQVPSVTLRKIVSCIARDVSGPVLDVGCGYGRNARLLRSLGFTVVCVDKDGECLRALSNDSYVLWPPVGSSGSAGGCGKLIPILAELSEGSWPFRAAQFGVIINVHFLTVTLFHDFARSLQPGGLLFIETVSGHGENYLELPKAGQLKDLLVETFDLEMYREARVGPPESEAVSVKLLAKKKWRLT